MRLLDVEFVEETAALEEDAAPAKELPLDKERELVAEEPSR